MENIEKVFRLDAEEELMEALALRDKECTMVLSTSTNHLEVAFLISNLAATLLLFLVSNMADYPRLHLPWMVFSSVEIVGNFVVAIAFLLVPGETIFFWNFKPAAISLFFPRASTSDKLCVHWQAFLAQVFSSPKMLKAVKLNFFPPQMFRIFQKISLLLKLVKG